VKRILHGFVVSLREMVGIVGLFRHEKILWAVVEPAGPDKGWNIVAVNENFEIATLVMQGLMDSGRSVTVRRHDLVQRDNREIAARVYRRDL
jgi:hypothetical protein